MDNFTEEEIAQFQQYTDIYVAYHSEKVDEIKQEYLNRSGKGVKVWNSWAKRFRLRASV